MDMEHCSETSTHKIQTPGSHPTERRQHSQQGESMKSRIVVSHQRLGGTCCLHVHGSEAALSVTSPVLPGVCYAMLLAWF